MCESIKKFNFVDHLLRDLDGYKCIKELGGGGFGTTYLFMSGKNKIVVKAILPEHTNRSDVLDEVKILEKIEPNCKRNNVLCYDKVYNYEDSSKKGVFIITEFLEGKDMHDYYIKKQNIKTLSLHIQKFLKALEYIHKIGLVHYDIKPANVMITKNNLKLIDFGLTKVSDDLKTIVSPSGGTPGFIPPEGGEKLKPDSIISFQLAKWFDYFAFFKSFHDDNGHGILDYDIAYGKDPKLRKKLDLLRYLFRHPTFRNYKKKITNIKIILKSILM